MRRALLCCLVALLAACSSAPPAPSADLAAPTRTREAELATQTRAAEVATQAAILALASQPSVTLPPTPTATATPTATPTPASIPPTATATATATSLPPTVTPVPPMPTATVSLAYYEEHFASRKRGIREHSPLVADVTGDGSADRVYISWVDQGCGASRCSSTEMLTVFSGSTLLLDVELNGVLYVPAYTLSATPDHRGFSVRQAATTGLSNTWTLHWGAGTFALINLQSTPPLPTQAPPAAPYRASSFQVANALFAANTAAIDACVLGTTVPCASGLQAGETKLDEARTSFYRLNPPQSCDALAGLMSSWLAAEDAFSAKLRTYGPRYDFTAILAGTQREVAAVNAAKDRWNSEYQYGACR